MSINPFGKERVGKDPRQGSSHNRPSLTQRGLVVGGTAISMLALAAGNLSPGPSREQQKNMIVRQIAMRIGKLALCLDRNVTRQPTFDPESGEQIIGFEPGNSLEVDVLMGYNRQGRPMVSRTTDVLVRFQRDGQDNVIKIIRGNYLTPPNWLAMDDKISDQADPFVVYDLQNPGGTIPNRLNLQIQAAEEAWTETVQAEHRYKELDLVTPTTRRC